MHSKVEAAQAHEIGHFNVVNGGAVVSLFVRDYEVTSARGITLASS
jgi:hypothetical protein